MGTPGKMDGYGRAWTDMDFMDAMEDPAIVRLSKFPMVRLFDGEEVRALASAARADLQIQISDIRPGTHRMHGREMETMEHEAMKTARRHRLP